MRSELPLHASLLLFPQRIHASLERVREAELVREVPVLWQITLGVARMWHRVLFRPETIGTSASHPVRRGWRARLLENRTLRFPFLVRERAVAPLDFSGLASSPERIIRHLLGAHHDARQFAYDLELLSVHPGKLEELHERTLAVVDGRDPRAGWLRDLVVYERYHERLLDAVEHALRGEIDLSPSERDDPDIAFSAYLRWCAAQPRTPRETLDAMLVGRYRIDCGLEQAAARTPDQGRARSLDV